MEKVYSIGVDAGGTKTAYGLFREGKLIDRFQYPTDTNADGYIFSDKLLETVFDILKKHDISLGELKGVGVCMPSYVLFDEGHICMTSVMTRVKEFPMGRYLSGKIDTKIVLDNDANCAALAEHRQGAGRGAQHMVYVATSTGIGGGLIINGQLFRGSYGFAGECGHMLATPNEGIECGCENKGCFMSYASGRYAPQHAAHKIENGCESLLCGAEKLDCESIVAAYGKGDALAAETIDQMAYYLAWCVYNVYQLLNINTYVFGGGLVNLGGLLFDGMKEHFNSFDHVKRPVYFKFAELEKDFGIIGAAELLND